MAALSRVGWGQRCATCCTSHFQDPPRFGEGKLSFPGSAHTRMQAGMRHTPTAGLASTLALARPSRGPLTTSHARLRSAGSALGQEFLIGRVDGDRRKPLCGLARALRDGESQETPRRALASVAPAPVGQETRRDEGMGAVACSFECHLT